MAINRWVLAQRDLLLSHIGARPDPNPLVISATDGVAGNAELVSLGNGQIVAAYSRETTEPIYGGVYRVFVRVIATPPRSRAVR